MFGEREIRKIFISGPMTGYPNWNYDEFDRVADILTKLGYEVVNPADIGRKFGPEKVEKDLRLYQLMIDEIQRQENRCDSILLLGGWEKSVGVRLELQTALENHFPILLLKDLAHL